MSIQCFHIQLHKRSIIRSPKYITVSGVYDISYKHLQNMNTGCQFIRKIGKRIPRNKCLSYTGCYFHASVLLTRLRSVNHLSLTNFDWILVYFVWNPISQQRDPASLIVDGVLKLDTSSIHMLIFVFFAKLDLTVICSHTIYKESLNVKSHISS